MAVYKRCPSCKKTNKLSLKTCKGCNESLSSCSYQVKVKDSLGKWKSKTVSNLTLAKQVEVKLKSMAIEGEFLNKQKSSRVSFDHYLEHYSKAFKKSWKDDVSRWKMHVSGKNYKSYHGIQEILKVMRRNSYSLQTQKHVLNLIRRVFNYHIEQGLWNKQNPASGIKIPKFDNRVNNVLDGSQLGSFISVLRGWENRRAALVIVFAIYTGRRRGEILSLKWTDVSFEHRCYTCHDTKNGQSLSFPLNLNSLQVLQEADSIRVSELVFPCSTGKYYESFSSTWQRVRVKLTGEPYSLPLGNYRFHDLRHTYASHLASSGQVDIYTLKTLLGHKDIKLTERYSHLSNDRLRKSTEVLDSLF